MSEETHLSCSIEIIIVNAIICLGLVGTYISRPRRSITKDWVLYIAHAHNALSNIDLQLQNRPYT